MSAAPTAGSASRPTPLRVVRPLAGHFRRALLRPRSRAREPRSGASPRSSPCVPKSWHARRPLPSDRLLNQGVTFSVYDDQRGAEKIFPFCLVPRVVSASDWREVERGIAQRIRALEAFLDDVYGEQHILAAKRIPAEVVLGAKHYLPQLRGVRPPHGIRIHVAGIDSDP